MAEGAETESILRRYFAAWTSRDTETVRALLAEDFSFSGGGIAVKGRDAFLDAVAFPANARTTMVAEAYQGEQGFQLYDAQHGERSARIVEHLIVVDGRIVSSSFVTDMASFHAFVAPQ